MMVAAVILGRKIALAVDRAAEFAAPNDQRIVEHAALFQVLNQRGRGLVGIQALRRQVGAARPRGDPTPCDKAG